MSNEGERDEGERDAKRKPGVTNKHTFKHGDTRRETETKRQSAK